jgi:hypothetical protein
VTAAARRRNSHRVRSPVVRPPTGPLRAGPPRRLATTIGDVAVDGSFPAEGHEERVRRWAVDTLAGWGAAPA